jgi:hypothetical protein
VRPRIRWTPEEEKRLRDLLAAGKIMDANQRCAEAQYGVRQTSGEETASGRPGRKAREMKEGRSPLVSPKINIRDDNRGGKRRDVHKGEEQRRHEE